MDSPRENRPCPEALGAKIVAVGEGKAEWVIMDDPEGNGFSVLSPPDQASPADGGAAPPRPRLPGPPGISASRPGTNKSDGADFGSWLA